MEGKVKWFSSEKGYGYIVGEDTKDYYFNVSQVQGSDLPRNGDVVNYEPSQGKKGPRASAVRIKIRSTATSQSSGRSDDRVECPSCRKRMVPRMVTYQGSPSKSLCPFCGTTYKDFSKCFIATAAYGDPYAPEVIALRRFRDESLNQSVGGRVFVRAYYRFSPPVASFLTKHPRISVLVRTCLNPLARHYG